MNPCQWNGRKQQKQAAAGDGHRDAPFSWVFPNFTTLFHVNVFVSHLPRRSLVLDSLKLLPLLLFLDIVSVSHLSSVSHI
jgi:hypothetical protein